MKEVQTMRMNKMAKRDDSRLEFNLLYGATFAVFFAAIAVARLLPQSLRWHVSGHEDGHSIVSAARTAASNSIPFAFM